jgi:EmrB/QacA subfamily drug resistance transporter
MPSSPPTTVHGADPGPGDLAESVAYPRVPLWAIVAIACLAQFMGVFQESLVSVALPAMKSGLNLSTTDLVWVVNAYMITFGGFLLLAARASDLFGRKRIFIAGLAVFCVAGLTAGLAQSSLWLIGALFIQGVGAAAIAPASLSLITASHPEGPARTKALAVWSVSATAAAPIGLVLGGVLTSALSWRFVLFLSVALGVAALVSASITLAPNKTHAPWNRLDIPGSLTVTAGTAALIYGVSEATNRGWSSVAVLGALSAAVVLLVAFTVIEIRSSDPLLPFGIFRNRSLTIANLAIACIGVSLTAQLFFVSLYLQQVVGYSAVRTGSAMVPMSIAMIAGAMIAKSLIQRLGDRVLLVGGAIVATAGVAWLSRLTVASDYPVQILGPTIVLGLGIGLLILPLTEAATAGVQPDQAGLASGLFNVTRQIGGAIGLAVLVTIATTITDHSDLTGPAATVDGYRPALLVCAAITLVAGLVGLLLPARMTTSEKTAGKS